MMVETIVDVISKQNTAQIVNALIMMEVGMEQHDITNKIDCNYDGGDCCGCNVNKQYHKQYCLDCQNLDPNGSGLGTTCLWQQQLV